MYYIIKCINNKKIRLINSMKFCFFVNFTLKKFISLLFITILLSTSIICLFGRNSIKLKNSSKGTSVQKFKFLFIMKLNTIKEDLAHPLNHLSYNNVLLSSSQVVK